MFFTCTHTKKYERVGNDGDDEEKEKKGKYVIYTVNADV